MKYIVRKRCQWRAFIIEPSGTDEPKVIDESELKTPEGKKLDAATVAHFLRWNSLVPCDDDGTPLVADPSPAKPTAEAVAWVEKNTPRGASA